MSEKLNYNVQIRERIGKGGAREARRNVIKGINSGHFLTSTANLVHDGKKQLVIPQAIQLHPVTDMPVHVDLYRVNASQIIAVEVPVHFTNEEEAPGIKEGGALNIVRFAVELNVRADSIPDSLEADLTGLEIGDNVKISDIKLPEGAEPTITDRDFTIATIVGQMAEVVEEDEEELEADDVEAINQSDEDGEGEAEGDAEGEDESKE